MWTRKSKAGGASVKALSEAKANLNAMKARGDEVSQVARELKHARERNHFAEQLQLIIVGHGRKL